MKNIKTVPFNNLIWIVFIIVLNGCATTYSSLKSDDRTGGYELIIAEEQDVLDAAYEAIQNRFPDTIISGLVAGKEKGFTFYTQPLLDRTTFKFSIDKANAITQDGKTVTGYYYSVYAQGTQWFMSRHIQPLISEFKRMLKKKGVTLIWVLGE